MRSDTARISPHVSSAVSGEPTQHAFEILHYNQNLIQFADTKANTLIVINSIALASTSAVAPAALPAEWRAILLGLKLLFMLASIASIIACLAVVVARADDPHEARRFDLVFFGDILTRKGPNDYCYEYQHTSDPLFLEDLLRRNFRVATIAARKYQFYTVAQQVTVVACLLWLATVLVTYLFAGGL